ncbi:MAG: hypothetical protein DMG97_42865 [Acidobacteria bacterium]|nr:MAG: hypothetical protein DMG97_42865 [Acidobacteriota bacterium]
MTASISNLPQYRNRLGRQILAETPQTKKPEFDKNPQTRRLRGFIRRPPDLRVVKLEMPDRKDLLLQVESADARSATVSSLTVQ